MSVEVYTETSCDRCPELDRRTHGGAWVPTGWAEVTLEYCARGGLIPTPGQKIVRVLCPKCAASVEDFLAVPLAIVVVPER